MGRIIDGLSCLVGAAIATYSQLQDVMCDENDNHQAVALRPRVEYGRGDPAALGARP
jgi:hypothetical protein